MPRRGVIIPDMQSEDTMLRKSLWVSVPMIAVLATVCLTHSLRKSEALGKTDGNDVPTKEEDGQFSPVRAGSLDAQQNDDVNAILDTIESYRPTYLFAVGMDPNKQGERCLSESSVPTEDPNRAAKEATAIQQESDQLRKLDSEQNSLEEYVAQERQEIEAWYTGQVAKLKSWAEKEQQKLECMEKTAKARYEQEVKNTESWTTRQSAADGYVSSRGYVSPYGNTYSNGTITERGDSSEKTVTRVVGDPAGEYDRALFGIKQAREAVDREFSRVEQNLRGWKERKLVDLETEVDRKRTTLNWHRGRIQRETQRQLSGKPDLTIAAIGISPDKSYFALVNDEIVREGSIVNGYRVRRIHANKVELEKDGKVCVLQME